MPVPAPEPLLSHDERTTPDLERFREYLRSGKPGPHAYVALMGLRRFDLPALLRDVERGLPYRTLERFWQNIALPPEYVTAFISIPRRTLTRRKQSGRLQPDESDRLLRAVRLFGKALELFDGSRDAAVEWLIGPQTALGGATPVDLARTELGAREVERILDRLEHGVFS